MPYFKKLWFKKRGLIRSSAEALVLPSSDPPERLQGSGLLEVPTEADVVPIDSEATAVGRRRKGSFGFAERSRDRSRTRSRDGPREQSSEWQPDPLGLSVVYAPNTKRSLDIIFVHGLGGSSRRTWCKNKDLGLFWPGLWLSQEVDISTARILSFGYNANYQSTGPGSILNISDFAKDLLYEMRFGKDEQMQELNIGEVLSLVGVCCLLTEFDPRFLSFLLSTLWEDSLLRRYAIKVCASDCC